MTEKIIINSDDKSEYIDSTIINENTNGIILVYADDLIIGSVVYCEKNKHYPWKISTIDMDENYDTLQSIIDDLSAYTFKYITK